MLSITGQEVLVFMAAVLFLLGMISTTSGIVLLVSRTTSQEVRTLAVQTARLAQKGLADQVAGLVGNATNLLDALNEMVKTTSGVGVFLIIAGLVFMVAGSYLVMQIL
jgi:hypothetical protein